jgi:hypothetical protein
MYLCGVQSDQLYTWSDEYPERTHGRLTKTPQRSSAPIAPAPGDPARLPHRALQTVRQAGMQMRRRPGPWSQVLSVGKLPGLAAANGLRTAGVVRANGGVPRQLPPSPRDSGGNLRDQPRTTAPSRGTLKGHHERIPGCPPRPDRCGIGRRAPGQYARRLARRRPKGLANWGGSR